LQVQQKEDGIFISQDKYVAEILKKFNYSDVKSASTPVDLEKPLVQDGDADDVDVHLYRSMIGSLMYLTASRPDIMFAVCACARFQVTPKTSHLLVVKRIFRYLKGKPTLVLWHSRDSPFELIAYTDSDYAGATLDRKSTTGSCEYVAAASCFGQVKVNAVEMTLVPKLQLLCKFLSLEALFEGRPIMSICSQVGNEAVHKELGDRMEKAATTASSLEAEQESDTILGYVNAQTRFEITSKQSIDPPLSRGYTLGSGEDSMKLLELMELSTQLPKFAETHNVVAFLEKPIESDGFAKTIDFLKSSYVHYALTVNPIIYTSCIEQFWATAKVHIVNKVRQLQALVDKKRVIIIDSSIRRDLHLDDAKGTDCLSIATIFEELARMGYEKPSQKLTFYKAFFSPQWKYLIHIITQCLSAKSTTWNEFSSIMASLIICLATNQKFNLSNYIFYAMKKQTSKKTQRKEAEVPQDETEHEESVPTPSNDPQPSAKEIAALKKRIQRLERKKMSRPAGLKRLKKVWRCLGRVEVLLKVRGGGVEKGIWVAPEDATKQERSIADLDKDDDATLVDETQERQDDELIFEGSAAPTTIEEITLAQTLIQIKAAKPKVVTTAATTTTTTRPKAEGVVVQEPSEFRAPQEAQPLISKDKGKAMIEADRLLAERLQSRERQELTDEEKGKLFMELMEKRRKHFATLRAQEKRNRPPTKAQKRTQMSTYLKHMGGYTYKQLKGKSFDEI
ncbi:hypothetical protein Tco_0667282, partial [Tanacetum coccineum]